jgi:hypothetical protein
MFSACNSSPSTSHAEETPATPAPQAVAPTPAERRCFAHSKNDDLIGLTIDVRGQQFTGNLAYALDGFDRTSGTLEGSFHADTLFADYTYNFNGKRVVREIAFLYRNNELKEAQSDVVERNGRMEFRNKSKLKFSDNFPLKEVPCVKPQY